MSVAAAASAPEDRAAAPLMSARRVSLLGAMLVAVGPISLALYTPAMPQIAEAFGTTDSLVKLTLTLYFGGFACAQLVAGPLSDALGRRPVTFVFMGIYLIASLLALAAPSIETLIAARFLQGVGASAGIAIARAVVRDQFRGEESSGIMNLIGIILAVGPALAPTIGGLVLAVTGWRALFLLMAFMGAVVTLTVSSALRETITPNRDRLNVRALLASYGELLVNRHFLTTTAVIAGAVGALYAQSTFLPFILMDEVGLTPTEFGVGMLAQTGFFFAGSLVVRALMRRVSAYRLVVFGLGFIVAGSVGVAGLMVWEVTYLHVMGPVAIYCFGIAFVMPAMQTAALAPFPHIAGAASSLMGFIQMGAGLVVGTLGAFLAAPTMAMATLIPMMGAAACIAYVFYRRNPHLAEPEPRRDAISGPPAGRSWTHGTD